MSTFFSKIKSVNHILIVFCIFGLRAGIFGASIGDAIFFLGFLSLVGYREWMKSKETPDINIALKEELKDIRDFVTANQMKSMTKGQETQNIKRYF